MHPIAHFRTITRHRHMVLRHCIRAGIPLQGLLHDLSKYSPTEFLPGALFYQGNRSPNEAEREKYGYSSAWMHHKGRNRHHFEYWSDINPVTKRYEPVEMPRKYICEMVMDRIAACKTYEGNNYTNASPLNYYLKAKETRLLNAESARQLELLLTMLRDAGEKKTFSFIRKVVLKGKPFYNAKRSAFGRSFFLQFRLIIA